MSPQALTLFWCVMLATAVGSFGEIAGPSQSGCCYCDLIENSCYKGMTSTSARVVVQPLPNKKALCDTQTDGGGWIVIQRRTSEEVDFYRDWNDYKRGFGSVNGNYWLGNEAIHTLTSNNNYELRIDMTYLGGSYQVQYSTFIVGDECTNYTLTVGGYSGNSNVDGMGYHNGMQFSTYDRDNDKNAKGSCAVESQGAWWYNSCYLSNLNGKYGLQNGRMEWVSDPRVKLTSSEMKIRLA